MNLRRAERLGAMGIRLWVPRVAAARAADSGGRDLELERIRGDAGLPFAALVAAAPGWSPEQAEAEGALLERVLASLQVLPERFAILRCTDPGRLDAATLERAMAPGPSLLLAFTGRPLPGLPEAVVLPTLAAMLADRESKRRAWQQLKPLVGKLAG